LWKIAGGGDGLREVAKEKPTLCDECFVEFFGFAEAFGCFWSFFENAFEELKFFDGGFGRACLGFFFEVSAVFLESMGGVAGAGDLTGSALRTSSVGLGTGAF
jgi:hypothetical protein